MRIASIGAIAVVLAVAWHSTGQTVPSTPSLQVSDADGSWTIQINTVKLFAQVTKLCRVRFSRKERNHRAGFV